MASGFQCADIGLSLDLVSVYAHDGLGNITLGSQACCRPTPQEAYDEKEAGVPGYPYTTR